jgi:hypothetical protein
VAHPFLAGSDVVMSNEEVYSVSNRLMAAGVDGMVEWVTVRDSTMPYKPMVHFI